MKRFLKEIPKITPNNNTSNNTIVFPSSFTSCSTPTTSKIIIHHAENSNANSDAPNNSQSNSEEEEEETVVTEEEALEDNDDVEDLSQEREEPLKKQMKIDKRLFRKEWANEFKWLLNKNDEAFCKCCQKFIVRNHAHLKRHQQSQSHEKNERKAKETVDISNFLKENSKQMTLHYKAKRAELLFSIAIVEHNLPFMLMDHLPQLLRHAAPDSDILKEVNCARTKSTGVIKLLSQESKNIVAKEITERKFSLIIDETTDVSAKKCLAILVRYVDPSVSKVRDRLLSMVPIVDLTAAGLTNAIITLLNKLKVPKSNLVGFAADNASVMMGDISGVKARLKEINDSIFVIGCICHSMALCASNAANKLPKELEDFVRNVYNYFKNSSSRLQEYKEFQEFADVKPHKLLKLSQTRWLSLEAVVSRILEQWRALQLYFQSAALEDNLRQAEMLLEGLQDVSFRMYLTFLSYVLPIINKINREFQSERPKICAVYDRITTLYKTLLQNFMQKEYINNKDVDIMDLNPLNARMYLPYDRLYLGEETALLILNYKLREQDLVQFKNNCVNYYIELCLQVRRRFQDLNRYKNFSLLNHENLLKDPVIITPLLQEYVHFTNNNIQLIGQEIREICNLPQVLKDKLIKMTFQDFWFDLYLLKNSDDEKIFQNVCEFVFNIFTLPHSSASAERIFSRLNLIKTKTRNRLLPETCNNLLTAKELLNDDCCYNWEPSTSLLQTKVQY